MARDLGIMVIAEAIETESERVISVPARLVVNFPKEAWLGSVSRRKLARATSRM